MASLFPPIMRLFLLPALFLVLCFGPSYPNGFVLDNGHILTAQQHRALDSLFRAHEERTGNEIALVTTDTLGGRSMKDIAVAFGDSVGASVRAERQGVYFHLRKRSKDAGRCLPSAADAATDGDAK